MSHNQTLTDFDGGDDNGDDATSAFLQQDDKVDALTDFQVKDVVARGEFMQQIIKANGPAFMRSADCDEVEELLKEGSGESIIQAAIAGLGRHHSVVDTLGWEAGPGNAETLFARWMNVDDYSEEELVEAARKNIKDALRGCGMPRINVMRDRVDYHIENNQHDSTDA